MTIEEIFSLLAEHLIEGVMFHSQLSEYFYFLGLNGYGKMQEYHFFEENLSYKELLDYYITHHNKLVIERAYKNPKVIPESWYQFERANIDNDLRKTAILSGFERWINWEKETKNFYSLYYKKLLELGAVAAAIQLAIYIEDVDKELADAEKDYLYLKSMDCDLPTVISIQDKLYKDYTKKLKGVF